MSTDSAPSGHSYAFFDADGDERCECGKWLEPGYYEWEDHLKSVRRSAAGSPQ